MGVDAIVLSSFLNPWMLMGLAGVLLPVIAHLLSRKKYDQVDWGAMQFLELDPSAKRTIRLEELLLLLVRMGLVAIVALAFARPWLGGQWLGGFASTQSRDVVLVIDGSYSTGWEGKAITPRLQSLQLARQFLGDLRPGDSVQIVDAREQPRMVLPDATRDIYRVREALNDLPTPSGSADLAVAINKAIQLLSAGTNLQREIVVMTDLQASNWKDDDEIFWARFDDVRAESPIAPRVWILDASQGDLGKAANFTIERLQLSRELAVIGVPVKISSKVRYSGCDAPITRKVHLEIDQQRLSDRSVPLKLQPNGEMTVDFEYRFETSGSHLISLVLDNDALPGDNRADAVVIVTESLPVLIVDGDHKLDPTKRETYFASAALQSTGDEHPWIKPTIVTPEEFTVDQLKPMSVVVIANVSTLSESAIEGLRQFAESGRGVLFTLGDKVDKDRYRELFYSGGQGLFPCRLESLVIEAGDEKRGVRVASGSLELPWLRPFRSDRGGSLSDARWSHWWKVATPEVGLDGREVSVVSNKDSRPQGATAPLIDSADERRGIGTTVVEVRLTTGDPLILSRRYGRGVSAVWTSSLDADWNTLPAKQDYVPFLHELLFSLASTSDTRNVDIGSPLILSMGADLKIDEFQFLSPELKPLPAERIENALQSTIRLKSTSQPGVYQFVRKSVKPGDLNRPEYFVVNFDRSESDLTQLTEDQRKMLSGDNRLKFVADLPDLRENMFADNSRAEFWWILLYVFAANLAAEAWMTRRMVRGGYSSTA